MIRKIFTSIADAIMFDPTLATTEVNNGYVMTWNSTTQQWEAQPAGGSGGGSGVTPPFIFSKDGSTTVGSFFRVGDVISSNTGQLIVGTNRIVKLAFSSSANVTTTTRVQLTRRTGLTSYTDITNAYIDIPAGNYKATRTNMSIDLDADIEIGAYNKSGSTISNGILMVFLVPR